MSTLAVSAPSGEPTLRRTAPWRSPVVSECRAAARRFPRAAVAPAAASAPRPRSALRRVKWVTGALGLTRRRRAPLHQSELDHLVHAFGGLARPAALNLRDQELDGMPGHGGHRLMNG